MNNVNYCWNEFTEDDFNRMVEIIKDQREQGVEFGEHFGNVRAGEVCFEIMAEKWSDEGLGIDVDIYALEENAVYGVSKDGRAYDYYGCFCLHKNILETIDSFADKYDYSKFKAFLGESIAKHFAWLVETDEKNSKLVEQVHKELTIW